MLVYMSLGKCYPTILSHVPLEFLTHGVYLESDLLKPLFRNNKLKFCVELSKTFFEEHIFVLLLSKYHIEKVTWFFQLELVKIAALCFPIIGTIK